MSVYWRLDRKYWYVDFYDEHGRRRRICTKTADKRLAQDIERRLRDEVARGQFLGKKSLQPTLAEVVGEYVDWATENKRSGDRARQCAVHLLTILGGEGTADKLLPSAVERYGRTRVEKGAAPGTVKREMVVLVAALNHAVRDGRLKVNPLAGRVRHLRTRPRIRLLSDEERVRLLSAAKAGPSYLFSTIALILCTGLRRAECLSLKWGDVDLEKRILIVRDGKGGKSRVIPLSSMALELLLSVPRRGETVIADENGRRIKNIKRSFRSTCRRAQIENLWLHDLRRAFASHLAMRGVSPWIIQHLLGHAQLRTSEIYVNISDRAMAAAVEQSPGLAPDVPGLESHDLQPAVSASDGDTIRSGG